MHRLLKANGDLDRILSNKISDDKNSSSKSFRRPDYAAEWRVLKKAWSLRQSGRAKLSHRKVIEGSSSFYENDPLEDFLDWLWRFSSKICQPAYENIFLEASKSISLLHEAGQLNKFESHYKTNMAPLRARYYFEVMREYFSNYSEFSQVHFLLSNGVEIRDDEQASSQHFDSTKMFYGNNFEAFASLVDVLALVNNVAAGRNFNVFGKLTLEEYYKLDKSGRFNPFSMNSKFAALCGEADNQLRNASHHGGMIFDRNTQNIKYRAGKGGIGPENSISYAKYLERCVRIFLQTMTLLRIELMFCREFGNEVPF